MWRYLHHLTFNLIPCGAHVDLPVALILLVLNS